MRIARTGLPGLAIALLLGAAPANAADKATTQSQFDVAFGVGVTTDYVARGISQTTNAAAVQGFVEFDYAQAYAGAWASNVSLAGAGDTELDIAVGWRPEAGKFAFDFGYVHYLYLAHVMGSDFGEAYAGATYALNDKVTLGAKVNFAPDYAASGTSAAYVEATLDLKLPNDFGISGALGYQQLDATAVGASYLNGNVGIYWNMNKWLKLDLRYSGTNLSTADCATLMGTVGNECGSKVMLSLMASTSLSDLSSKKK
jgi:uncharacterized protein (TIGR02001 family)